MIRRISYMGFILYEDFATEHIKRIRIRLNLVLKIFHSLFTINFWQIEVCSVL